MTDRTQLLADLRRTRDLTLPYFSYPPEIVASSYAPGKWSVRQLLMHLTDHESVVLDRLRRTAADPAETVLLPGYDQDAWANGLFYQSRSLTVAARLYDGARSSLIELIELLPADLEGRSGLHSQRGRMTLLQQGDTWGHNDHHLVQIRAAVERAA